MLIPAENNSKRKARHFGCQASAWRGCSTFSRFETFEIGNNSAGSRKRREHPICAQKENRRALSLAPVIASEAKQSISPRKERMDCFVAYAPRNDGSAVETSSAV